MKNKKFFVWIVVLSILLGFYMFTAYFLKNQASTTDQALDLCVEHLEYYISENLHLTTNHTWEEIFESLENSNIKEEIKEFVKNGK